MSHTSTTPSLSRDQMLNTAMTAVLLDIPKATLVKWRSTGEVELPFIKIGRAVRYNTNDLRRWLEKNTQHKLEEEA